MRSKDPVARQLSCPVIRSPSFFADFLLDMCAAIEMTCDLYESFFAERLRNLR